jgi:hypothetical protein
MLLRHGTGRLKALRESGATVQEFTAIQVVNSKYDFLRDGAVPIRAVAVIADDQLEAVYRVGAVEREGTTWSVASPAYQKFDRGQGFTEKPAKRFSLVSVPLPEVGRPVHGWTSPRVAVARYGGRLCESIEVG